MSHKNERQPVNIRFSGASYLGGSRYMRDNGIPRSGGAGWPLRLVQCVSTTDLVLNVEACRQRVEDPGCERFEDLFRVPAVWNIRISGQLVSRPTRESMNAGSVGGKISSIDHQCLSHCRVCT